MYLGYPQDIGAEGDGIVDLLVGNSSAHLLNEVKPVCKGYGFVSSKKNWLIRIFSSHMQLLPFP